jgi:hypothetical protein
MELPSVRPSRRKFPTGFSVDDGERGRGGERERGREGERVISAELV